MGGQPLFQAGQTLRIANGRLRLQGQDHAPRHATPNGNNFREWISAAHIVWTKETPEFLAEFANVNHRNILTNFVTNSQAFYAQVGYRLPWLERTLKALLSLRTYSCPADEQVFTNQGSGPVHRWDAI